MSRRTLMLGVAIFIVSMAIASQITNLVAVNMLASGTPFWAVAAKSPYLMVLTSFVVAMLLMAPIASGKAISRIRAGNQDDEFVQGD